MGGYYKDSRTTYVEIPTQSRTYAGSGGSAIVANDKYLLKTIESVTSYRSGRKLRSQTSNEIGYTASDASRRSVLYQKYDTGHTFSSSVKRELAPSAFTALYDNATFVKREGNGILLPPRPADSVCFPDPGSFDLGYWGPYALANAMPKSERFQLFAFLGELREGFPSLANLFRLQHGLFQASVAHYGRSKDVDGLHRLLQFAKREGYYSSNVAQEYLSYQFGWAPLIGDLSKLIDAMLAATVKLQSAGTGITYRRARQFPETNSTTVAPLAGTGGRTYRFVPGWPTSTSLVSGSGIYEGSRVTTRRESIRFHGKFASPFGDVGTGNDVAILQQIANNIDLRATPSAIWQLVPWSWLIGWFNNLTATIALATAVSNDGMVIHYGYLTRKVTTIVTDTLVLPIYNSRDLSPYPPGETRSYGKYSATASYEAVYTDRYRATPYGFGLNPGSFSNFQWSILAALGLTKASRTLRLNE
jgi:hypothetical protein